MLLVQALQMFESLDDPNNIEYPKNFDYVEETGRFTAFVKDLEEATGKKLEKESGVYIQDASFHSQARIGEAWLRFSNFGSMIALFPENAVSAEVLCTIKELGTLHGFVVIPEKYMEIEYSGAASSCSGIRDWGIRFFDWL